MANEFTARNGIIAKNNSIISGSLIVTQNISASSVTGSFTGSFSGSYQGSITTLKASSGSVASFGGQPYSASVAFTIPYVNNSYAVSITGEDSRAWSILGKSASGFIINSNSSVPLSNPVYWIATPFNL